MGKVITIGQVKGGCGKTTVTAITAHILSENHKVLCMDTDGQGNLTEMLTLRPIRDYRLDGIGGVLDAIKGVDTGTSPFDYIFELNTNLHLMPASELMTTVYEWLFTQYKGNRNYALKNMIDLVKDNYDYVLIDTPPELGYMLINCMAASDGIVAMYNAERFCHSSLLTYHETISTFRQRNINNNLRLYGILCTLLDARRSDAKDFLNMVRNDDNLGKYVFDDTISRKAAVGRLSYMGFDDNPELKEAIKQYRPYVNQLLERMANDFDC